jgi:hypothetical protein
VHVALLTTSLPQVKVYSSPRRNGRLSWHPQRWRADFSLSRKQSPEKRAGEGRGEGFFFSFSLPIVMPFELPLSKQPVEYLLQTTRFLLLLSDV